ncbi:MAG: Ig-like domain-containing protein, partial [Gemmatimonadetes bacterium]|nr:Ig-like domain-containing protein [Gemmatimonadota bacterium]
MKFPSLGETAQLTATVHDQNGNAMVGAAVAWASTDPTVATVDQSGLVTAAGNGETNLTATAGAATAMVAVVVEQVPNSIVLSALPDSLAVGDSIQMTAEALDGLDNLIAGTTFEWSSSDTMIATIDQEGWVRAKAAGSTEITAAAGTTASATAMVTGVQGPRTLLVWAARGS